MNASREMNHDLTICKHILPIGASVDAANNYAVNPRRKITKGSGDASHCCATRQGFTAQSTADKAIGTRYKDAHLTGAA
jgi:hypothetical protein